MNWFEPRVLRSARPFVPSGGERRDEIGKTGDDQAMVQMMCDLVLGEIQAEISRVEKEMERRRQDERRLTNQPDYSWLMDWRLRAKRPLSFRESSEVELLCSKVRAEEWRRLLKEWHTKVRFAESRDEVLDTFRALVDEMAMERMRKKCVVQSVDEQQQFGENTAAKKTAGQTDERGQTAEAASEHGTHSDGTFGIRSVPPRRRGRLTDKKGIARRLTAMKRAMEGAQDRLFSARGRGEVFYVRFY
ncbi:hypothetical protein niasHT_016288 [Heterodera trifolii]|uniref:Uncharacterized protein n=1 Tax=Heterodera trifolii TaxID=157864 RepID=A0ABD2LIB6_9BILA